MPSSSCTLLLHCSSRSRVGTITIAGWLTSSIAFIPITVLPAPVGRTITPLLPALSQDPRALLWYALISTLLHFNSGQGGRSSTPSLIAERSLLFRNSTISL